MYVSLNEIKQQLNIDQNYSGDNAYLEYIIQVAEDAIEQNICHPLTDYTEEGKTFPPSLKHAIMFYASNLYANRESISYGQAYTVPDTFHFLLSPFKKYY